MSAINLPVSIMSDVSLSAPVVSTVGAVAVKSNLTVVALSLALSATSEHEVEDRDDQTRIHILMVPTLRRSLGYVRVRRRITAWGVLRRGAVKPFRGAFPWIGLWERSESNEGVVLPVCVA